MTVVKTFASYACLLIGTISVGNADRCDWNRVRLLHAQSRNTLEARLTFNGCTFVDGDTNAIAAFITTYASFSANFRRRRKRGRQKDGRRLILTLACIANVGGSPAI